MSEVFLFTDQILIKRIPCLLEIDNCVENIWMEAEKKRGKSEEL